MPWLLILFSLQPINNFLLLLAFLKNSEKTAPLFQKMGCNHHRPLPKNMFISRSTYSGNYSIYRRYTKNLAKGTRINFTLFWKKFKSDTFFLFSKVFIENIKYI